MSLGGKITFVGADNKVHSVGRDGFEISEDNIVASFKQATAKIYPDTRFKIELALKDHTKTGDVDVESFFAEYFHLPATNSHKEAKRHERLDAAKNTGRKDGGRLIKFVGADNQVYQMPADFSITSGNVVLAQAGFFRREVKIDEITRLKIDLVMADEQTADCLIDVESYYADRTGRDKTDCEQEADLRRRAAAHEGAEAGTQQVPKPSLIDWVKASREKELQGAAIQKPVIDDIILFGMVDRTLSEMKYILDNPGEFDQPTFQTMKHHLEDMELFLAYAKGLMVALGKIKNLPPVKDQMERGY